MSKETKARVASAFRAMKAIGISEDKVKPVLKNLLKLYDKNWALIEEENYRALADAIFDRDEQAEERSKKVVNNEAAAEQSKKIVEEEAQVTEEPEQPLKRLRLRYRDGQSSSKPSSSSLPKTPLVIPKEEHNEIPETHPPKINGSQAIVESPQPIAEITSPSTGKNKGKQPVSSKTLVIHENSDPSQPSSVSKSPKNNQLRTESRSQQHSMRLRDRGTSAASPQKPSGGKRPAPESSSRTVHLKEPKVEPGIPLSSEKKDTAQALIVPKDEPITDDTPCLEAPDVIIHPDTSNGGEPSGRRGMVRETRDPEPSALQSVSEKETADGPVVLSESRSNGEMAMVSSECSSNLEVASSPSGEVKFYLSYDLASKRPGFHVPTLEALLKSVEDKCLRSPKTSDPYIPMMDLMKEMCRSFLELGSESNSQSPQAMDVTPAIDPTIKPSELDGLSAGVTCSSPLNGSAHYQTRARVSQAPKPAVTPPGGDVNHEQQPKKMVTIDEIVTNGQNQENCSEAINILSLEVVQQPQTALEIIGSPNAVVDIAKGQEKVVITLVNEVNDELPPSFFYIPQNAAFQNAYVNISLARIGDNNSCGACSGDCLSLSVPCACAHETGGEFAYTADGLVKEELLKESISMNRDPKKHCQFFCKECPLERSKCEDIIEPCKGHLVFMAPGGKGWGLRTLEDLPKGAFVCEYVGEVLTNAELFERVSRSPKGEKHSYPVLLDADWCAEGVLKDEEALCLDATYYGNVARFINHRYRLKWRLLITTTIVYGISCTFPTHFTLFQFLAFFTTRKVKAMEELTWDYGIDFDDHEHPIKAFQCQCGSKYCRNIKRSRSRARR
ncbi:histone-lysine n-methyltransferase suvr2 [Phtheirospermum japonicum]|uniref:Histone-lysine n-methyltransferase suvr2 n=1 Tax=Phtheirospermum japonicum TaxID=374723 RepID=A0A830B7H3_9LAMI|nr:histone-lysine n-methyltransferase suvr2 [Phtheirospermum japonicum]